MRILAIGECMAELAPLKKPGEYSLGFAGDTLNTAWYLAQIAPELQVSYFSAVGDDEISGDMRRFIRDSGINAGAIEVVPGATIGLYLIQLKNGERSFTYWRGQSAAKRLADNVGALASAIADHDVLYFSGITLAILNDKGRETVLRLLGDARKVGKRVVFDPNLRPKLWSATVDMTATIMRGAAVSDIILPSFDDERLYFDDNDPDATLQRYENAGAHCIVVKNGSKPVVCLSDGKRYEFTVPLATNVVDSTAAGDSFNAGFLHTYIATGEVDLALEKGASLAHHVISRRGALVPVSTRQ